MDECVRLEEALRAKEPPKTAEQESPPARHRSRWPFSLKDFAKTDEFRLPTLPPELAAFSRGLARASPRRRRTKPSSLSPISARNDNLQRLDAQSHGATHSPEVPIELDVEKQHSHTGTETLEERPSSHNVPLSSKQQGKQKEVSPKQETSPGAATTASLDLAREDETARPHHTDLTTLRPTTDTLEREVGDHATGVEDTVAADSDIPEVASQIENMQQADIVDVLRSRMKIHSQETGYRVKGHPTPPEDTQIAFRVRRSACIPGEFNNKYPQRHGALVIMEIALNFPKMTHTSSYSLKISFHYEANLKELSPEVVDQAVYTVDEGDSNVGRSGKPKITIIGAGDSFCLYPNVEDLESKRIVIRAACLLRLSEGRITRTCRARIEVQPNVGWGQRFWRKGALSISEGHDIEVPFQPDSLERHGKRLVLDDLNSRQLLHRLAVAFKDPEAASGQIQT